MSEMNDQKLTESSPSTPQIGRNEPCPCGSRKKYKRCCGVAAAPKLTTPVRALPNGLGGAGGLGGDAQGMNEMKNLYESMNPEIINQFTQAFQRLPKGQIQRFQHLMQKAMSGKDIAQEAAEFEKTLPPEFQAMIQSMGAMGAMAGMNPGSAPSEPPVSEPAPELSLEQARALVAQAAAEGKISQEKAKTLLQAEAKPEPSLVSSTPVSEPWVQPEHSPQPSLEHQADENQPSKFKKFWKGLSKSKPENP